MAEGNDIGKYEWNYDSLLRGRKEDEIIRKIKSLAKEFTAKRRELKVDISAENLREILDLKNEISTLTGVVSSYYGLKFAKNTQDSSILAKMTVFDNLMTDLGNEMIFFSIWFMHLDDKNAERLIESRELSEVKYYLERLRTYAKYTKSEEIERIMSLKDVAAAAPSHLYGILTNSFTFNIAGKEVTKEEAASFVKGKDPELREEAYNSIMTKYGDYKTLLSEMYKSIVVDWYNDNIKIRKYDNPISVMNTANDVSPKAVDALKGTVRKNAKLFHEYFKIKHDINTSLGANYEFSRYHIYAPFEKSMEKEYGFSESKEIVLDALKNFDSEFYEFAKKVFNEGNIDAFPEKNKRGGAFCMHPAAGYTPYIMLNHTNKIRDISTMAHELGHAIHDMYSNNRPQLVSHPTLPMAETASIFNEMLLNDRLLSSLKDDDEKAYILMNMLDDYFATIPRQVYFNVFEVEAHDMIIKGATQEQLDEKYMEILKEQFGDMVIPDEFRNEWNYIPHTHESPFYVYSYAWGNLLVLALYQMYQEEGDSFKDKYKHFLSLGGSKSPMDALQDLGIDPESEEFWQKGMDMVKERVDELRQLSEKYL